MCCTGKEKGRKRKMGVNAAISDGRMDRCQQAFYKVVDYCVAEQCRRAMLLAHFGERLSVPCSGCDWCLDRQTVSQQVNHLKSYHLLCTCDSLRDPGSCQWKLVSV